MNLRKATFEDIDLLIRLRLDYLLADRGSLTPDEERAIHSQLTAYFPKHLNEDFIAYFVENDHEVVSTAFLVIYEKPANPSFITGKIGNLLNVLTYPEYRRKGLATMAIKEIIAEAKKMGVSMIELSATPDGKPVYEKLGFKEPKYTGMRLRLV